MKEKRILAMFITSAITLVASLAVTFGVLMTLADPVVATGLTRYSYNFNAANDTSLIAVNGNTLSLRDEIAFNPTKSVEWKDGEVVWFNGTTIEDEVVYADESVSSKIKVVPLKVKNNYTTSRIDLSLVVDWEKGTTLGQYTFVKIWSYKDNAFIQYNNESFTFALNPSETAEYAVVIYADESTNFTANSIDWTNAYETINVSLTNNTVNPY